MPYNVPRRDSNSLKLEDFRRLAKQHQEGVDRTRLENELHAAVGLGVAQVADVRREFAAAYDQRGPAPKLDLGGLLGKVGGAVQGAIESPLGPLGGLSPRAQEGAMTTLSLADAPTELGIDVATARPSEVKGFFQSLPGKVAESAQRPIEEQITAPIEAIQQRSADFESRPWSQKAPALVAEALLTGGAKPTLRGLQALQNAALRHARRRLGKEATEEALQDAAAFDMAAAMRRFEEKYGGPVPRVAGASPDIPEDEWLKLMDEVAENEGPLPDVVQPEPPRTALDEALEELDIAQFELESTREIRGAKAPNFGTAERTEWEAARRARSEAGLPNRNRADLMAEAEDKVRRARERVAQEEGRLEVPEEMAGVRPPRRGPTPQAYPPSGPTTATPRPVPRPTVAPPPGSDNILGLRPIEVGLTRDEKLRNIGRSTVNRFAPDVIPMSDIATPAMRERGRVREVIESVGNAFQSRSSTVIRRAFKFDDKGRIPELADVDPRLPGAPTIQDVAARYPVFEPRLTDAQKAALNQVRDDIAPYKSLLDELQIEVSYRPDVEEGGFYLPRGNAALEGADEPMQVRIGRPRAKAGFERTAQFDSMSEGIEKGYAYAPFDAALGTYSKDAGWRALDTHLANYFKTVTDESGELIGETAKMRMLRQNPTLLAKKEAIDNNLARLRSLERVLSAKQQRIVDDFINNPDFDDIDAVRDALDNVRVEGGPTAGATRDEVRAFIRTVEDDLAALRPEWRRALARANQTPRGAGQINLAGLDGRSFPLQVANAANAVLAGERTATGALSVATNTIRALNNMYRGLNATLDNSGIGIQGMLGLASQPRAYSKALKVNFLSWGKGGDEVLGAFLMDFDRTRRAAGRMTSVDWSKAGLRIGGQDTEFMLGRGYSTMLAKAPGVRQANRAYGYFGDALRLEWADSELNTLMTGGLLGRGRRTLDQIRASGDLDRIAQAVNGATGYSPNRFAGNIGELLLFAPRFLQARLETLARAVTPTNSLQNRVARRALLKFVGGAVGLTVAVNEMLGNDTDFNLFLDDQGNPTMVPTRRLNSNFMRVRWAGRDWSLLGTYDSLARSIMMTAQGKPHQALRGMGSANVSVLWDVLSNEQFTGEPVRDNPEMFAEWTIRQLAPFSVEEAPEIAGQFQEGDVVGGAGTLAGEVFGAKSSPLSGGEAVDVERKAVMEERGLTGDFDMLPLQVQAEINDTPAVKDAKTAWEDTQRERQSQYRAYADERDSINDKYTDLITRAARELGPGRQLREVLAMHGRDRAREQGLLRTRSSEALEWLEDKEPAKAVEGQALDAYIQASEGLENPVTGEFDFEERERRMAALRQQFGEDVVDGVQAYLRRNEPAVVTELRADREALKPYWGVADFIAARHPAPAREIWDAYQDMSYEEQGLATTPVPGDTPAAILQKELTRAIVNRINREISGVRGLMRERYPEIRDLLLKWGYTRAKDALVDRALEALVP